MLNLQLYFDKIGDMFLFNLNQIINKKLTLDFTLRNPQVNPFLNLNLAWVSPRSTLSLSLSL